MSYRISAPGLSVIIHEATCNHRCNITYNMAKIECVFDASGYKVGLGEGPHWDDKNERLLWLDIFDRTDESKGKTVHISDPATGNVRNIYKSAMVFGFSRIFIVFYLTCCPPPR